jgi:hypothetical protein
VSRPDLTIGASLASLPFIVPHVLEDFSLGIAGRVGLSTPVGACLLGVWLAAQSLGLASLAAGRRGGWLLTAVISTVWIVVAIADHGPDVLAGAFRSGTVSVLWVVGLIVTQGTSAALAWTGFRRVARVERA